MTKPANRRGPYQRDAARTRATATASTRCAATPCHYPDEHGQPGLLQHHPDGSRWEAGHPNYEHPSRALRLEADVCNRRNGATYGNNKRAGTLNPRSDSY